MPGPRGPGRSRGVRAPSPVFAEGPDVCTGLGTERAQDAEAWLLPPRPHWLTPQPWKEADLLGWLLWPLICVRRAFQIFSYFAFRQ